jgi:hypothetical protein
MIRGERGLAILVRWPEPGQVMPRLSSRLGPEAAAQVYESFIADLAAPTPGAGFDRRLYALDRPEAFRARYPEAAVRAQRGRSEGRRLRACFEEMLATYPLAVVVGSSLPDLHPRLLESAFEMLERRDVVVGPTDRGGFYLLGMREPRDVFVGIKWGAGSELVALLRNLERAHLDYGFFPTRRKVETAEDLAALRRRLPAPAAPRTHAALRALGIGEARARRLEA